MKKFSLTQINLLTLLSNGQCHSGNDLGVKLNISRTAIWKQITQLIDLGLPIQRIPKKGYCLTAPMTILNEHLIREQLNHHDFDLPIDFHMFAAIDSTNRLLKELPRSAAIGICCAETQTAGRGRFDRHWYSPFGENIYCSSRWHFNCDLSRLSALSLLVSLAILATLDEFGINEDIHVKWPNDILWGNKKLCGNLIEIVAESNSSADVIIGIGLNVNSNSSNPLDEGSSRPPEAPWCSLYDITGNYIDRNLLIASLLNHLNEFLNEFLLQGFNPFITKWYQTDYLYGKKITVSHLKGSLNGIANGVNEAGQLILIDDAGTTHYLSSGDTSLHAMR